MVLLLRLSQADGPAKAWPAGIGTMAAATSAPTIQRERFAMCATPNVRRDPFAEALVLLTVPHRVARGNRCHPRSSDGGPACGVTRPTMGVTGVGRNLTRAEWDPVRRRSGPVPVDVPAVQRRSVRAHGTRSRPLRGDDRRQCVGGAGVEAAARWPIRRRSSVNAAVRSRWAGMMSPYRRASTFGPRTTVNVCSISVPSSAGRSRIVHSVLSG